MSDLEQILSGAQPEPEVEAQADAPEPEKQAEPEPQAEPAEKPQADPEPKAEEHTVPVSVVQELRRELRELRQAQTRQEPKPAPDVFDDPEGYRNYMQDAVKSSVTNTKLEMSRFMAERDFGKDVVQAAFDYFEENPQGTEEFLRHPSPFHAAVEQFNAQRVAKEIGSDPVAWAAKERERIRKELEAEAVAKQARDKAGKFAPSMADLPGTGGGPKSNWTGPTPLDNIIGS